jgi:hypothetical protein
LQLMLSPTIRSFLSPIVTLHALDGIGQKGFVDITSRITY